MEARLTLSLEPYSGREAGGVAFPMTLQRIPIGTNQGTTLCSSQTENRTNAAFHHHSPWQATRQFEFALLCQSD